MGRHRARTNSVERIVGPSKTSAPTYLTRVELLGFYEQMVLIRRFELTVRMLFDYLQLLGSIKKAARVAADGQGVTQT